MTVYNLGSINADYVYQVPHLPAPGETIGAGSLTTGLGGKGANQSVAAARAGSAVVHIGAVGPDGDWAVRQLGDFGVVTNQIATVDGPSGHAIINVAADGENNIVTLAGANHAQDMARVEAALATAEAGDVLLLQNETTLVVEAAQRARSLGLTVIYSAAPFDLDAARKMLFLTDILILNEVEATQLSAGLDTDLTELPMGEIVVTKGAAGVSWYDPKGKASLEMPAFSVEPLDTTGAGDTFAGTFAALRDQGADARAALRVALAAAAVQVTRLGAAEAIPTRAEVDLFLART
ncbi:MAG: ribokinase [Pseudomonadota bacterium]